MQEKFDRATLEPISVVLTNEDEANAVVFALRRYHSDVEIDALTLTTDQQEQVAESLGEIEALADDIEAGEREIPAGDDLMFAGSALKHLLHTYDVAMSDAKLYHEMTADLPNPAAFILYVSSARDIMSPSRPHEKIFVDAPADDSDDI